MPPLLITKRLSGARKPTERLERIVQDEPGPATVTWLLLESELSPTYPFELKSFAPSRISSSAEGAMKPTATPKVFVHTVVGPAISAEAPLPSLPVPVP